MPPGSVRRMAKANTGAEKPVTIMITRSERELIQRYGYPFEDIERQLKEAGDVDIMRITDSPFWWEQVIVNLHISEEENFEGQADEELADDLRALIERIAEHLGLL